MGLQTAFPTLRRPQDPLIPFEGAPPDLWTPPRGCRFAPRCPFAVDRCRAEAPPLRELEPGRWAACHRADEAADLRVQAQEAERWRIPALYGRPRLPSSWPRRCRSTFLLAVGYLPRPAAN